MRENDRSLVFKIDSEEHLNNLVRTVPENRVDSDAE
jgi:hypothetical protein